MSRSDGWQQVVGQHRVEYYFSVDTLAPVETVLTGVGNASSVAHSYSWTSFSTRYEGLLEALPPVCATPVVMNYSTLAGADPKPGVRAWRPSVSITHLI